MPMPPPSSVKPVVFKTAQDILDWQPTNVSPLMISSVPVAPRPASSDQRFLVGLDNGEWSYWSHFDRSPQGGCRSDVYNFQFWQYVDEMYYYMHNLAAVPPVVWTNAAHRNGVRMFAAVTADFTNGGTEFNTLFQDPVKAAGQLFKIVNTYRFDGWMFDVERGAIASPNLLKAMQILRAERLWNNERVAVGYYEAGGFSIDQGNLPFFKAGSFFQSDYISDPNTTAPKDTYDFLGKNGLAAARYGTYWSVYTNQFSQDAPVDGGLYNGCVYLDVKGFFRQLAKAKMPSPPTDYYQSIGIYAPDWTMYGGIHESRTPIPERDVFLRTERLLWAGTAVGADGKPVTSSPCVADFIPPRTTLVAPPFVTRFNTGQGWCFVVEEVRYTISDWNYLSGQDLLPTSLVPTGAPPPSVVADYTYDDPYDGGSALAFSGTLSSRQSVEFPLFAAKMSLPAGYQAQFTYKARTAGTVLPQMTVVYSNQTSVVVKPTTGSGWTRVTQLLPPTPLNVYIIGIRIDFHENSGFQASVDALIGELAIVSSSSVRPSSMPPITPTDDLLTWTPPAGVPVGYYNVFGMTVDGLALMGRTILPRYDLTMALFPNVEVGDQYVIQTVNTMGQASVLPSA